jgi:hypothetical protein
MEKITIDVTQHGVDVDAQTGTADDRLPDSFIQEARALLDKGDWRKDPKAVEAVEYLLSIGFNADDFMAADIEASGEGERVPGMTCED